MIVNYFILLLLIFLYTFYNTILIVFNTPENYFSITIKIVSFWVTIMLVVHIFYCMYIYFKVLNMRGLDGPKGITGPQGINGKDGRCNASCGQKVCNALIRKAVNKHLEKYNIPNIKNKLMINKINKICFSDNYYGILISKHKNRPNEKKLIEYLKELYINWIDLIMSNKKGRKFLMSEWAGVNFFKKSYNNPFDEITKYDIWSWGEPYKMKPIIRIQCAKKKKLPTGDFAKLFMIETNDYLEPIFTTHIKKDVYGPDDCPYNQLDEKRENSRGIKKCYYYDSDDNIVSTKKVFKQVQYKSFKQPFSFYNIQSRTTTNNQIFYPVGSVWRGTNNIYKTKQKKSFGPEKKNNINFG